MLVNNEFIFLQLQKTGGTYLESLILEHFPQTEQLGKHFRPSKSFDFQGKKVIGSIRNPWEWYLSYWSYSCLNKGGPYYQCCKKKSLTKFFTNGRKYNCHQEIPYCFNDLTNITKSEISRPSNKWARLYENANDPERFREWIKLVLAPERKFDLFQDYGVSTISNFAGIYTYLFFFLFAKDFQILFDESMSIDTLENIKLNLDGILKTENLESDFIFTLNSLNIPYHKALTPALAKKEKANTSNRAHPTSFYYDKETAELVANKEKFLINKFDYVFD
ncbi:hypothetical protein A3Q34_09470 [Colwellia sp. PAMC 20917]|uniref:hypothetical protein n=1 Tax=Colwellia sp. PAMC 20917 TaxID=1816218 RepID=UPI000878C73C|nr:hypothetical protein [Colwellia sp. PAMC 20917]AOW77064.1 hypothetical protein A3Q34_09470 [Colwellia sp. PAMC 20917]